MINGVANGPLYFFPQGYMRSLAQTSSGARYHGEVLEGSGADTEGSGGDTW